ncbi:MAG: hypothetical protein E2O39_09245 [Planctomycetota bacterium]|nr:MAG: hypothetical protein E2O39_09245 [Planctomycetota bacterium]
MRTRTSILRLSALVVLPILGGTLAAQDRQLKDRDLKDLGKQLANYVEAREADEDVWDAEESVKDALAKLQKKLKGKDPLSLPADFGQAIWMSKKYEKAKVKRGKVADVESDARIFGEQEFEYTAWAPSKYSAKNGPYPLIISIHDEEPDTTPKSHIIEEWRDQDLRAGAIIVAPPMPEDFSIWSVAGTAENPGGVAYVLTTFNDVSQKYAIDFDRVYLAGRGTGVAAAIAIASLFPDRFAGVIGRAGDAGNTSPENFQNLPTYFAGGGGQATAFDTAIRSLGFDNCTLDPTGLGKDVWNWMQSHPRISNPMEVTLVPGAPFPNRASWIQVPPTDGQTAARIHATIDRATNTITVNGEGIDDFTIFLNDVLVDLDKPVIVICNGAENVDLIPRNLKVTLDMMYFARSDPGKVFVANKSYHLPPPASK